MSDIIESLNDCIVFQRKIPLNDEYGKGTGEVASTIKALGEAIQEIERLRALTEDIVYLAAEAFEFTLSINPHAGVHDSVEEHTGQRPRGRPPLGDWISDEQRIKALDTGRLIEGQVYPNGSVSFFLIWGTDLADVVAECAKCCREDRAQWMAGHDTPPQMPRGRD